MTFPFPIVPPSAPSAPSKSIVFTDQISSGFDQTTYTFTGRAIGAASASRFVVVGVVGAAAASRTISSVTIGGSAATLIVKRDAIAQPTALYGLVVAAGTTADIVVTFSGTMLRCSVFVYALTALASTVPVATGNNGGASGTTTNITAVTATASGFAIMVSGNVVSEGATLGSSLTWSANLPTEDADTAISEISANGSRNGAAHSDNTPAGSQTWSSICSVDTLGRSAVVATFF